MWLDAPLRDKRRCQVGSREAEPRERKKEWE
jgi:hypothetical protein